MTATKQLKEKWKHEQIANLPVAHIDSSVVLAMLLPKEKGSIRTQKIKEHIQKFGTNRRFKLSISALGEIFHVISKQIVGTYDSHLVRRDLYAELDNSIQKGTFEIYYPGRKIFEHGPHILNADYLVEPPDALILAHAKEDSATEFLTADKNITENICQQAGVTRIIFD